MTNHVLGEVWTFLRRRDGHETTRRARHLIEASTEVEIARVSDKDERAAWLWLDRHHERTYSFVDATSFAIMRRKGMVEALNFDGDFAAAGFIELRLRTT